MKNNELDYDVAHSFIAENKAILLEKGSPYV
jgi:hypothetical protein